MFIIQMFLFSFYLSRVFFTCVCIMLLHIIHLVISQLGGTDIMFSNGVSHQIVDDDFEGVLTIMHWLSFVPASALSQVS